MELDRLRAAGVYDPEVDGADERLELLRYLDGLGATTDQLVEAHADDMLVGLASEIDGDRVTVSLRQLAERLGYDTETFRRMWLALGLPAADLDDPVLSAADADDLAGLAHLRFLDDDSLLHLLRITGNSVTQIAEAGVYAYIETIEVGLAAMSASDVDRARAAFETRAAYVAAIRALLPVLGQHTELAIRRNRRTRRDPDDPHSAELGVGFVDLTGFTPLSAELTTQSLADLVAEFESLSHDTVVSHGGWVVKYIGDEVMFAAETPDGLAAIAAALLDVLQASRPDVTARGSIGFGSVLAHHGDYFGPVVNVAARAADVALPGEILLGDDLRDRLAACPDGYHLEPAGRRKLAGVEEPVRFHALMR